MNGPGRGGPPGPKSAAPVEKKTPRCPICGKPAALDHRPFCSKRCADIDLGRWLKGAYAVPGENASVATEKDQPDGDEPDN